MAEKKGIPNLKCWHFEVSEDIITKFKSQGLYIIRIKYWNAGGFGNPPSLIPALWNIGILLHKQAIVGIIPYFRPSWLWMNLKLLFTKTHVREHQDISEIDGNMLNLFVALRKKTPLTVAICLKNAAPAH